MTAGGGKTTVVAVYNAKGGVGKTSTAVNLAHVAACQRKPTLVWDLDPQGAATYLFRVRHRLKGGVKVLTTKRDRVGERIRGTDVDYLDLLPSDFDLRHTDVVLAAASGPTTRLSRVVSQLDGEGYELIVIDCPPSSSLISENIFAAADLLVIPVIPTTLAVRTLDQVMAFLAEADGPPPPVKVLLSMVDRRKKLHGEIVARLQAERADVLRTVIPAATEVEQMGPRRAPVGVFAPASSAAAAYRALWAELAPLLS